MGSGCSSTTRTVDQFNTWKLCLDPVCAKNKYITDGTLDITCSVAELELRALLESPIAIRFLLSYTDLHNFLDLMRLWSDCREGIMGCAKRDRLFEILSTYEGMEFHRETPNGVQAVWLVRSFGHIYDKSISSNEPLSDEAVSEMYQLIQNGCFQEIFTQVYEPFSKTMAYSSLCKLICDPDNWVTSDSFQYLNVIAQGSFGVVIRCRKKSTGIEYAMKIQPKVKQLKYYQKDKRRVMTEMQAYSLCDHPYVTKLAYATQTSTLTMLVMPIAGCGDLARSLTFTEHGRFSETRVQFYAAEIISALLYLHRYGILYRDLKPANILLNADGHIMLADFGSVADVGGLLQQHFNENIANISNNVKDDANKSVRKLDDAYDRSLSYRNDWSANTVGSSGCSTFQPYRTKSLVGTAEYMAPEIILLFGQRSMHKDGYTAAVDWWSLGILIYKLLVGVEPFIKVGYEQMETELPVMLASVQDENMEGTFNEMFGKANYAKRVISEHAANLLSGLLKFDPTKRLSGGFPLEDCALRNHGFFADINWSGIESKTLIPPYIPTLEFEAAEKYRQATEVTVHEHLVDKLTEINRLEWMHGDDGKIYTPPVCLMAHISERAKADLSRSRVIVPMSSTTSASNSEPNSRKYQVKESDQGYFFGWNYVANELLEGQGVRHTLAVSSIVHRNAWTSPYEWLSNISFDKFSNQKRILPSG